MSLLNFFRKEPTMAKPTWPPTLENSRNLRDLQSSAKPSLDDVISAQHIGGVTPSVSGKLPDAVAPAVSEQPPTKDPIVEPAKVEVVNIPKDGEALKEFFQNRVFTKPSSFIQVMKVADRLKEFISDDAVRAKAALATIVDPTINPESISKAIDQHISDLETERIKAKDLTSGAALAKAAELKKKSDELVEKNSSIDDQVASLHASINRLLQEKLTNTSSVADLEAKIEEAKKEAESFGTIDGAAETIKTDLLAKKAAIGVNPPQA